MEVDVLVAGGGPAGASTALGLATMGLSVCLVEGPRTGSGPRAETLPPTARSELLRSGFDVGRLGGTRIESFGIDAHWAARRHFHSHVLDPEGNAWHVEREEFTAELLTQARVAGANSMPSSSVVDVARSASGWRITVREVDALTVIGSQFLVDATGRGAVLARRLGARRHTLDALCGIAGVFKRPEMAQTLCVESSPVGWWYLAPFGDQLAIACLMSDADLIRAAGMNRVATWRSNLLKTMLPVGPSVDLVQPLQTIPCETSVLDPVAGDGWIAVGDAACLLDPLASAGVLKAVHDGSVVATAVLTQLAGSTAALNRYTRDVRASFGRFLIARRAQYRLETRWRDEPFWRRRCA